NCAAVSLMLPTVSTTSSAGTDGRATVEVLGFGSGSSAGLVIGTCANKGSWNQIRKLAKSSVLLLNILVYRHRSPGIVIPASQADGKTCGASKLKAWRWRARATRLQLSPARELV